MKKNKSIIFIIIFLVVSIFATTKCYAINASVEKTELTAQGLKVKVTADKEIKKLKIYSKVNDKYVLFYISNPNNNSLELLIPRNRLSEENQTSFKIVVNEEDGTSQAIDLEGEKLPSYHPINPEETEKPSWSPSPLPTKPTPSPSPSTTSESTQSSTPSTSSKTETSESEVSSIKLNKSTLSLKVGESETLTVEVTPKSTSTKLTWSTDNKSVATVDKNGKVTAKKGGTATIAVKTANGKTAECKVTVASAGLVDEDGKEITEEKYISHAKNCGDFLWDKWNSRIHSKWHGGKCYGGDINAYTQSINILWCKDYKTCEVYDVVVKNNPEWKTKTSLFFFNSEKSNEYFKVNVGNIDRNVNAIKEALSQGKVVAAVTNSNRWRDNKGNIKKWAGTHWGVIFLYDGKYFHVKGGGSARIKDGIYTEKQLKEWLEVGASKMPKTWRQVFAFSRR